MSEQQAQLSVFISYSVHDTKIVDTINAHLSAHARTMWWKQDKVPGQDAWTTIYGWIDSADLVVVLVTGKTLTRALSVGNEVGYARKAGKKVIPLVAADVPKGELGCLEGVTYITLDSDKPERTITELHSAVNKCIEEKKALQWLLLLGLAALGAMALSK